MSSTHSDIEFSEGPYVILNTSISMYAPNILLAYSTPPDDPQPPTRAPKQTPPPAAHLLAAKKISKIRQTSLQWDNTKRGIAIHQRLTASHHPGIVPLLAVIDRPDRAYLLMERLDGDLVNLLQRRAAKRLDEREARGVFKMAVDIVAFLHSEGIVHRDLKLENFLVEWEGEGRAGVKDLKLTDFDSSDYTLREPFEYSCGSPPYSAPELCTTNPHFSGRIADIWSLGVMLYVLVCGTFPWHHPSLLTLFDMIRTRDLDLPPHLSPDLQHLLQNILQKAPSKRFTLQQILNHDWMAKYQS